jgi:metal-responsive CopG/Arc/MetJ family transcriptional regulator
VKRIQIYIEEAMYEQLTRHARRERRSKAALIRDAVRRQYADEQRERFDDWAGGIDEEPGDVDDVVYGR